MTCYVVINMSNYNEIVGIYSSEEKALEICKLSDDYAYQVHTVED